MSGKYYNVDCVGTYIRAAAGVPCVPGYHGENQDPTFLYEEAKKIGRISYVVSSFVLSVLVSRFSGPDQGYSWRWW